MFFPVDGPNVSSSNRNDPRPDIKKRSLLHTTWYDNPKAQP